MLSKLNLEVILKDWNYWDRPLPVTIPRKILTTLSGVHDPDLILVVQGVRRCGKSTLLLQMTRSFGLNPLDCTFVNFEDPRLSDQPDYRLLDGIVAFSKERRPSQKHYFFFDEIQNISGWQKWLHVKMERPTGDRFLITGSNASLLSGDLSSALTGRHRTLELFPFDFSEFQRSCPGASFEDYLVRGGFPRVLTHHEPQQLLREYFTDIIERDVRRHVRARSALVLIQLVKAVFEATGSEVSQRNLAGLLGVTADTVGSYLDACEQAYILLSCPYFTFSERQRTARNKKYYPIDLGLKNAVAMKTGQDRGKSLETIVYFALRKKFGRVFYWRNKGEVDFVAMNEEGIFPYQVSWDEPQERHHTALQEFYESFPQAQPAAFVTRNGVEKFLGGI